MTKINSQYDIKAERNQAVIGFSQGPAELGEKPDLMDEFADVLDKIAEVLAQGRQHTDTIDLLAVEQMAERIQAQVKPVSAEGAPRDVSAELDSELPDFESPERDEGYLPAELLAAQKQRETELDGATDKEPESNPASTEVPLGMEQRDAEEKAPVSEDAKDTPVVEASISEEPVSREPVAPLPTGGIVEVEVVAQPEAAVAIPSELGATPGSAPVVTAPPQMERVAMSARGGAESTPPPAQSLPVDAPVEPKPSTQPIATEAMLARLTRANAGMRSDDVDTDIRLEKSVPLSALLLQGGLAPSGIVSREAVAQAILRPGAGVAAQSGLKEIGSSSKAGSNQSGMNMGGDPAAARGIAQQVTSETSARPTKALSRVAALRTLEKVERALEEVARSKDGKTISLDLEPVNLGKVKVDVSIRDGSLHARLSAESTDVRQLLREHAHELQSILRKLGLQVDSVAVSVATEEPFLSGGSSSFSRQPSSQEPERQGSSPLGSPLGASDVSGPRTVSASDDHWIA